jgi:hypothetical protein
VPAHRGDLGDRRYPIGTNAFEDDHVRFAVRKAKK